MTAFFRRRWRWIIAAAAVALLVRWVGPAQLAETIRGTRPLPLLGFLAGFALTAPLYGVQIWVGLRMRGRRVPFRATLAAAVTGWAVGTLTPARAGDLSIALLLRGWVDEEDALGVVVADKLISLSVLALLATASAYVLELPFRAALFAVTATLLVTGAVGVYLAGSAADSRLLERVRGHRLGGRLVGALGAMVGLLRTPRALLAMSTVALLRWLYICQVNLLIFMAFAHRPGFVHLVAGTAVGRIVSIVPVTVGGVGLKEPVQMVIYADAGVPENVVLAVSLVGMACAFVLAALWPLALRARTETTVRA